MLFAAFLPLLALGALALFPLMEDSTPSDEDSDNAADDWNEDGDDGTGEGGDETDDDGADDDTDEDEGELDDDELIEDETPLISIALDGEDPVDAMSLEEFNPLNGNKDPETAIGFIRGTDGDDVVTAQEGASTSLSFDLGDGDDIAYLQLGHTYRTGTGTDHVEFNVSAEGLESNIHEGDISGVSGVVHGDTIHLEIDPSIEGRFVLFSEVDVIEYDQEHYSARETISVTRLYLVPDDLDVMQRLSDLASTIRATDDIVTDLFTYGADDIFPVLFISHPFDDDDPEGSTSAYDWNGLTSNHAIESYTI